MNDRSRDRRELFERDGYVVVERLLGPAAGSHGGYERARGFDHGKSGPGRENRSPLTR